MSRAKVAISIDARLLREVDQRVAAHQFASRSEAIETAVARLLEAEERRQVLLGELAKLDVGEERHLADEELAADLAWPKY